MRLQGFFTIDRARDRYGGDMRKLALIAALIVVPLTAAAEDGGPPGISEADEAAPVAEEAPVVEEAPAIEAAPAVEAAPTATTTTTITAPGATPVAAPAPASPVVQEDPCGIHKHARWRHRMKGRISIGFSKSHIELDGEDGADETEGKQKSFVVRLNGRRGWSIELELSKLTLDGGDQARTAGASLVKTFGRRKIAPYVLAGGGGGRYEHADGTEQKLHFGEFGGGVMLRGKRFSIGVDMRRGVRKLEDPDEDVMRVTTPGEDEHDHDHYTRGRVLALFNF
jgi:hypothetical protein